MNDKSYTRIFFEGIAFGAGLVIIGGFLKFVWNTATDERKQIDSDDDLYGIGEGDDQ